MYTGMSGVISFRTDDEVVDTVDRIVEQSDEDVSRALMTKRLVEEAVEARETPLWVRVGLSDRRAAQIEALRQEGETEEDLARELFGEALEARKADVLDAIGASDELREAVEDRREDGESLDGAVERLLRAGVEADTSEPDLEQLHEDLERLEDEIVTRRADMMSLPFIVLSVLLTIALLFVLLI